MVIYGLDPGVNTGFARYVDGKIDALFTMTPLEAIRFIETLTDDFLVVMEDSRATSTDFRKRDKDSEAVSFAKGRSLGRVDGICAMVEAVCSQNGIPLISLSPKEKGAKMDADQMRALTGWDKPSNSHTRDAALVAYPFRHKRG
jgi:hypothetical protein